MAIAQSAIHKPSDLFDSDDEKELSSCKNDNKDISSSINGFSNSFIHDHDNDSYGFRPSSMLR